VTDENWYPIRRSSIRNDPSQQLFRFVRKRWRAVTRVRYFRKTLGTSQALTRLRPAQITSIVRNNQGSALITVASTAGIAVDAYIFRAGHNGNWMARRVSRAKPYRAQPPCWWPFTPQQATLANNGANGKRAHRGVHATHRSYAKCSGMGATTGSLFDKPTLPEELSGTQPLQHSAEHSHT